MNQSSTQKPEIVSVEGFLRERLVACSMWKHFDRLSSSDYTFTDGSVRREHTEVIKEEIESGKVSIDYRTARIFVSTIELP